MLAMLADAFVKAPVRVARAAVVPVFLRRSPASLRPLVWTLACGGVLALPLASALLPNWKLALWPRLDVPAAFDAEQLAPRAAEPEPRPAARVVPTVHAPTPSRSSTIDAEPVRWHLAPDWPALVFPVWLSGVAAVLIRLAVGIARITWVDRVTRPVDDEAWLILVDELSLELGLRRHVRVLQANGPAMPMTWGIRRPAILLPAEANDWTPERRRDVLLHEVAHVKRHDFLIELIARIACAVYWFHPLVWLAATRLREERERACDDHVLRAGATPSEYAWTLLETAPGLRAARATSLASVAMARPAQLATRLIDVLDTGRSRETLSARSALPAWIAAIAVVVPLAAAAPRVAEPTSVSSSIDTIPRVPARGTAGKRSGGPAVRSSQPAAVALDTLRGCTDHGSRRSTHSHEGDGDVVTLSITTGGGGGTFAGGGELTLNGEFTHLPTPASGGRVVIEVGSGAPE